MKIARIRMVKFAWVLPCLILWAGAASAADWVQQNSGTSVSLYDVSFVDESSGWMGGNDASNLFNTQDGGVTWTTQGMPVSAYIRDVDFCDALHGVATGSDGAILYTQDGGATYTAADWGWMLTYDGSDAFSPDVQMVVGSNTIFQPFVTFTADGWKTKQSVNFYFLHGSTYYEGNLMDVRYLSPSKVVAVGRVWQGDGAVCMSSDGGHTWQTIFWADQAAFNGLDFPSANVGYAVGINGAAYKTTDAGATWQSVYTGFSKTTLYDVDFVDDDEGIAVGSGGVILYTNDGGLSWTQETSPVSSTLMGVQMTATGFACAVGDGGVVLTRNGAPLSLTADTKTLPVDGGLVNFGLNAGATQAGRHYLLLGGVTGTQPGTPLPGGHATLPLNWDIFTEIVLSLVNTPIFSDFYGTMNGSGAGAAMLNAPAVDRIFVGVNISFAFALMGPYDFASNSVTVQIVE